MVQCDGNIFESDLFFDRQLTSRSLSPPLPPADSREKKSPAMPGSPVDAKTHSRSAPSSSSTMPPLPSVSSSGPRPASFSTTACKRDVSSSNLSIHSVDFVACVFFSHVVSYKRLGSTGPLYHLNPSLPPLSFSHLYSPVTNGNHHSPPTLNAVPSPPQRYSNGPSSSSSSSLANQQLPATCGARQLSKLKRFLTTLQQFGNDISPEIGDSVRSLVLALVVSSIAWRTYVFHTVTLGPLAS